MGNSEHAGELERTEPQRASCGDSMSPKGGRPQWLSPKTCIMQRLSYTRTGPTLTLPMCWAHLGSLQFQVWEQQSVQTGPRCDGFQHLDNFPRWPKGRSGRLCPGHTSPPLPAAPVSPGLTNRPAHWMWSGSHCTSTESGPSITRLPHVTCSCSS